MKYNETINFEPISTNNIILAYKNGIFPMAENEDSPDIFWVEPKRRGIIDIKGISINRKLKKLIKQNIYDVRINTNFTKVIEGCAKKSPKRKTTWINGSIIDAYIKLHQKGYAHSIECYSNNILIGGLYGVSIGSIFFGESMFSNKDGASKIALLHLLERLKVGKYIVLDTQFITNHLKFFGAKEISQKKFLQILKIALESKGSFFEIDKNNNVKNKKYPILENFT
tara:strand:- start:1373 stop:2050 length:678 start_codon:yes stop_codon:yes gene_type:complete